MIRAFWHHFKDIHRAKRLQNGDIKVQDAMRVLSRRIADAEFHRTMAGFYTDRVIATDPHTDWWGFADAKQKQHDHQHDCLAEEKRIEEARATVEARKAELAKLRAPLVVVESTPLSPGANAKSYVGAAKIPRESKNFVEFVLNELDRNEREQEAKDARNLAAAGLKPELPKHCGPVDAKECLYCGKEKTDFDVIRCVDAKTAYLKAQRQKEGT